MKLIRSIQHKYLLFAVILFSIPAVSQASEAGQKLKEGGGKIIGIIMTFAFLIAIVLGIGGGMKFSKGDKETGKMMFIGAGIIAGAVVLIKIIFSAFGMDGAAAEASFDY